MATEQLHLPSGVTWQWSQGVAYLHAGASVEEADQYWVLLHGIGGLANVWMKVLQWIAQASTKQNHRICAIAWNAPGYGAWDASAQGISSPLETTTPTPCDYGQRLWDWLDALAIHQPVMLVGHSLGALMSSGAMRLQEDRVEHLVWLAPARGYGSRLDVGLPKMHERLKTFEQLGAQGLAMQRSAQMLGANASKEIHQSVQHNLSSLRSKAYAQAIHLLTYGDILQEAAYWKTQPPDLQDRLWIAHGNADAITPPEACQALAQALHLQRPCFVLEPRDGSIGHIAPLEAASGVIDFLKKIMMRKVMP